MREEIVGLREEMRNGNTILRKEMAANEAANQRRHEEYMQLFNSRTNAILDAMNRGNDRYRQTNERVDKVETRVTKLENPTASAY